jgi:hypothetical protein
MRQTTGRRRGGRPMRQTTGRRRGGRPMRQTTGRRRWQPARSMERLQSSAKIRQTTGRRAGCQKAGVKEEMSDHEASRWLPDSRWEETAAWGGGDFVGLIDFHIRFGWFFPCTWGGDDFVVHFTDWYFLVREGGDDLVGLIGFRTRFGWLIFPCMERETNWLSLFWFSLHGTWD